MRIVYLGTPEFAVAPLKKLLEANHNIVGVVTALDKPAGRGKKLRTSAVKDFAIQNNIPLLQPESLKDKSFLVELELLKADLNIVVAFRMLPKLVWDMPKFGTFNLHASLLPNYRGAAPINRAIMNGEEKTGVSTFFIDDKIDTGGILMQESLVIDSDENAGSLHDKLMTVGADLVVKTVDLIDSGKANIIPQTSLINNDESLKMANKIFKEDMKIDWSKSCEDIYNLIRGLSPYPAAFTNFSATDTPDIVLKIYKADKRIEQHRNATGIVSTDCKKTFSIACSNGWIDVLEIQQQGKKRMPIEAFLAGYKYQSGVCK